jgi:5'-3' exonuclease
VQYDRRKREIVDENAVVAKFGVRPGSIADYLALVGDSADGYPGISGWGAKSAAAVLAKFGTIEAIPQSSGEWGLGGLRGIEKLSKALRDNFADALLFKRIATVELDVPVGTVDDWEWHGPTERFDEAAALAGVPELVGRAHGALKRRANRPSGAGEARE